MILHDNSSVNTPKYEDVFSDDDTQKKVLSVVPEFTANKVNRGVYSSRQPAREIIVSVLPEETPADYALQASALSASPLVPPDARISWATRRLRQHCRYLRPFSRQPVRQTGESL